MCTILKQKQKSIYTKISHLTGYSDNEIRDLPSAICATTRRKTTRLTVVPKHSSSDLYCS